MTSVVQSSNGIVETSVKMKSNFATCLFFSAYGHALDNLLFNRMMAYNSWKLVRIKQSEIESDLLIACMYRERAG